MEDKYKSYCREGVYPSIIINNARRLNKLQFRNILKRIRDYIAGGGKPNAVDSETIGDKYTNCDWGLCTGSKQFVPLAELHTFPKDFDDYGRISLLKLPEGERCPMDRADKPGHGCFYSCRIFKPKGKRLTKEEALKLYDEALS